MNTCPVCNSDGSFAFRAKDLHVYRCAACRLEFLNPQPDDDALAQIYTANYFLGDPERAARLKRATAALYVEAIGPPPASSSLLLELGCGNGDFLLEASAKGWQVEGLEFSRAAADIANARLGCAAVRVGTADNATLQSAQYDCVVLFDVLEHVRDPQALVRNIQHSLRPGGMIAIVTPSLDSWSRRLLGRYWVEYKTEHLTYFSSGALRTALAQAGFTGIQLLSNYKILSADYVAHHLERYPVPVFSPVVSFLRRCLPGSWANHPFKIVASGVMALARKV